MMMALILDIVFRKLSMDKIMTFNPSNISGCYHCMFVLVVNKSGHLLSKNNPKLCIIDNAVAKSGYMYS